MERVEEEPEGDAGQIVLQVELLVENLALGPDWFQQTKEYLLLEFWRGRASEPARGSCDEELRLACERMQQLWQDKNLQPELLDRLLANEVLVKKVAQFVNLLRVSKDHEILRPGLPDEVGKVLRLFLKEELKEVLHEWFIKEILHGLMEWLQPMASELKSLLKDLLVGFLRSIVRPWKEELGAEFDFIQCLYKGSITEVWLAQPKKRTEKQFGLEDEERIVLKYYTWSAEAEMELACLKRMQPSPHFPRCWHQVHTTLDGGWVIGIEYVDATFFDPCELQEMRVQLRQAFQALQKLHAAGIVHRDLKPPHLLVERETDRVVLIDLGLAKPEAYSKRHDGSEITGTIPFVAPEDLEGEPFSCASDMWVMGLIMAYVLIGHKIFKPLCMDRPKLLRNLLDLASSLRLPDDQNGLLAKARSRTWLFGADAWDLMCALLVPDPKQRLTASEALSHAFFSV